MSTHNPIAILAKQLAPTGSSLNNWGHNITPLHRAARDGDVEQIKTLMASGADPDAQDDQGNTPLHWAAMNVHADAIKELLSPEGGGRGADPNKQNHKGETAMMYVAEAVPPANDDEPQPKEIST